MPVDGLPDSGVGSMLQLIREGRAVTRAELARRTGLARSTVAHRVDALLAHRLVYEVGERASTGGRPPIVLAFNKDAGVLLVGAVGASRARVAICDLAGTPLDEEAHDIDVADGPEPILGWLDQRFGHLLRRHGRTAADVRGIGVGLPGPVAYGLGRLVEPPIMPGWDGFCVPTWFARRYDAPVLVDNDVNLMALGEHRTCWRDHEPMLFVKVGTGIGCGIIAAGGRIHRGAQGAAGDIGHVRLPGHEHVPCRCGNVGCLEAVASGAALGQRLAPGVPDGASHSGAMLRLVQAGDQAATHALREAGRLIGQVLAGCVSFFNPRLVVIGGDVGSATPLIAGVREAVFRRSLPMATRDLRLVVSRLGERAGVLGAAIMVTEHILSPQAVEAMLQSRARDAA